LEATVSWIDANNGDLIGRRYVVARRKVCWEVLKAHDLHRDWDKDPETKEQVAEMLTGTWGSHVREQ
jgi:hypothetical protein